MTTKNTVSAVSAPVLPVVSVAAFSADDRQAAILAHSDAVRAETLRRCYAIPSYEYLTATEKNAVYERVRREVEADIFASSAPWLTCNDCVVSDNK